MLNNNAIGLPSAGSKRGLSRVTSESMSMAGIAAKGGDAVSRLGAQTRTTEHTSHVGMNNTTTDGGA